MRYLLGAAGVLAVFAAWEAAAWAGWVDPNLLTPPSGFVPAWWGMASTGELHPHVLMTVKRILVGFAIGSTFGFALGVLCHLVWAARAATAPVIEIVRAIPPLALLPAFLLLFGLGFRFPVAVVVWVAWVPVFLSTLDGLDEVPQTIREAAWEFTPMPQVVWHVGIPVAAPQITTGLRLALGSSFLVIVAAEMMGSTIGVGYYILDASSTFRIPQMYAMIATLGALAFVANWLLVRACWLVWPHLREVGGTSL